MIALYSIRSYPEKMESTVLNIDWDTINTEESFTKPTTSGLNNTLFERYSAKMKRENDRKHPNKNLK
jgi:hypothetical protein